MNQTQAILTALALPLMDIYELECPTCEQPVEPLTYHRQCLLQRCGGVIPEQIESLIELFEIEESE